MRMQSVILAGTTWTCLSSQVTNQSRVQGLLQDVRSVVERGHVQRGWAAGVAGSSVALAGYGRRSHVQRGGTLLIVLALALLIQRQGQTLALLPPVTKPNTNHLSRTTLVIHENDLSRCASRHSYAVMWGKSLCPAYISLQPQVIWDMGDLLGVGLGTLHKIWFQSRAHSPLQAGPPLPLSGVNKYSLNLVHLRN